MATLLSRIVPLVSFCLALFSFNSSVFAQLETPVRGLLPQDATIESARKPAETNANPGLLRATVPFTQGDVFAAVGNGQVQHYDANGNLLEVLDTGMGGFTTGMANDESGRLFVTNFSASSITAFSGPESPHVPSLFATVDLSSQPESILFDENGDIYVGQANDPKDVLKFDSAGNLLDRFDVGVTTRGADWIDLAADQRTMFYTSEGREVLRYDVVSRQQLPPFATGLPGTIAFALRLLPGGGLLVADSETVLRLDANGAIVQTYDAPGEDRWFALNLAPDGTSFWSGDFNTSNFYKFDINSGQILVGPVNTGTGFNTFFGLAVFGELTVSNNQPPVCVIDPPGPFTILEGDLLNFVVTGTDPDPGDVLEMNGFDIPSGAVMTPALPFSGSSGMNSTFEWTPGYGDQGSYQVTYTVTDSSGESDTSAVNITVEELQRAPECFIAPAGPFSIETGQTLTFTVSGADSNLNDQIVMNTGGLPSGAAMNPALPLLGVGAVASDFSWTPAAGQEGSYVVDYSVTDGGGRSSLCTVSITVTTPPPLNDPPVCMIDPPGPFDIEVGDQLMFMVTGSDPNQGDLVTLFSDPLPAGAGMNPALPASGVNSVTSMFDWTPVAGQEGSYSVAYVAIDSLGLSDTSSVTINVTSVPPVNEAPYCTIDPAGPFTITTGQTLEFMVAGGDPNQGDTLTLNSGVLPAGAVVTPALPVSALDTVSAIFNWTPAAGQEGSYSVSFDISDQGSLADTCVVNIVVETGGGGNQPPVCSIDPAGPFTVNVGELLEFTVSGNDPDGDTVTLSGSALPAGASMDPALPVSAAGSVASDFSWTPVAGQEGSYGVSYVIADSIGLADTCVVSIVVENIVVPTDSIAPYCQLTANDPGPPETIELTLQDFESGLSHINVLRSDNATLAIPSFTPGTTDPVIVVATKIDNNQTAVALIEVVDVAGNTTICDPVYQTISAVVPEGYTLTQNYPNPFNPSTLIRFDLPASSLGAVRVSLRIYDIRGRLVRSLIDENVQAGQYEVSWDGKNSSGEIVAGGVYFYRLVAGDFAATRKMVFMK